MWIPEETLDKVRSQVNIVDIISQYVQLKLQGKNHFGSCPFHEERTPSFSVQEEKQFFHCFSCGRGGNVFSFIMEIEGLEFPEAVVKVAELGQVSLDSEILEQSGKSRPKQVTINDHLLAIHEKTAGFYHQILMQTAVGKPALDYLVDRGLTFETIKTFQLGYSPPQREALRDYLNGVFDFDASVLKQTGLFSDRSDDELLDRFSNRIIFPIENDKGEVVAFSGRHFDIEENSAPVAKYLNSPETKLFNKSDVLYNFHRARPEIRSAKEIFLFEGYMDVIAAWQAGVNNGVATMGTSLTNSHTHRIEKLCERVIVAYDGDTAGMDATNRAIALLEESKQFDVEVVIFPDKSDPDDYIQSKGVESFNDLMHHGRNTVMGFYLKYFRKDININNETELLTYIENVLQRMVNVPSAIEREMYLTQLSQEFHISQEALKKQFNDYYLAYQKRRSNRQKETHAQQRVEILRPQIPTQAISQTSQAENILLYRLFHHPNDVLAVLKTEEDFEFTTESSQLLYILFNEFYQQYGTADIDKFIDFLQERELKEKVASIEIMTMSDQYSEDELMDCIDAIAEESLQQELRQTKEAMQEAARSGDTKNQETFLMKIIQLTRQLERDEII